MTGPYPYPGSIVTLTELLIDKIAGNAANFIIPFTEEDVYYGDQDRIPRTPSVCLEPGDKNRELEGSPNMTKNQFQIYILIYHNKAQDIQLTRKECDQLAYDIEQYIHQDLQLKNGGTTPNVIHGFIRANESGYTFKQGTLYRTARLTYYGLNKTSLPLA
jgi:hypothetical protein